MAHTSIGGIFPPLAVRRVALPHHKPGLVWEWSSSVGDSVRSHFTGQDLSSGGEKRGPICFDSPLDF
ncbi:hypothetical protein PYK22_03030 [Pyrinomonas methylaliphatogenes]|uniref:Uncharacterized protein n=1 Tax=Pyrinomonas methylaliphatogenes TaxID=454194 RepID=A0A0B6X1W1_9BACT|nr:hypothetical protein PYK22_03030 [Pyrinomonas methylaliphatogenes]